MSPICSRFAAAVLLAVACHAQPVTASADPGEEARVRIVKALATSAVRVTVVPAKQVATGAVLPEKPLADVSVSGFVWDSDGHVITSAPWLETMEDGSTIVVRDSGDRSYAAKLVGWDPATDVAVLHIDGCEGAALAHGSSVELELGRTVLSIGSPFGLEGTLSMGIVSGTGRTLAGDGNVFTGMIQTNLPVNPGDAGAPVVDSMGRVVGMTFSTYGRSPSALGDRVEEQLDWLDRQRESAKSLSADARRWIERTFGGGGTKPPATPEEGSIDDLFDTVERMVEGVREYGLGFLGKDMDFLGAQGISFALPIEQLAFISTEILERGGVERGWLGLTVTGFPGEPGAGARVFELEKGGPAERAGLRGGDVILEFDGKPVGDPDALFGHVSFCRAGDQRQARVRRGGEELELTITLGERPGRR